MIDAEIIEQVERLLVLGRHSYRAIARMAGVSRGTVGAVAAGKRSSDDQWKRTPMEIEPMGPTRRCPTCGGKVQMPCRLCQTRELLRGGHLPSRWSGSGVVVRLELKEEHRRRYERVRGRREEEARRQARRVEPFEGDQT